MQREGIVAHGDAEREGRLARTTCFSLDAACFFLEAGFFLEAAFLPAFLPTVFGTAFFGGSLFAGRWV